MFSELQSSTVSKLGISVIFSEKMLPEMFRVITYAYITSPVLKISVIIIVLVLVVYIDPPEETLREI